MNKPLRIGIIGLGGAGRAHFDRFSQNKKATVAAVFDSQHKRLLSAVKDLGLAADSVRTTCDWQEFLTQSQLDVVSICSPDFAHAQQAIECLDHGLHVLCEKPMATTRVDAARMLCAATCAKRKLMIHHQMRFVPTFVTTKQIADNGSLGKIFAVEADYYHDMRERATRYDDWRVHPTHFQNIIFGAACHPLDLMQWVLGEPIVEVFAYASHDAFPAYPDVDTVYSVMKFRSGRLGRMAMTIGCSRPQHNPLVVLGSEGTVVDGLLLRTNAPAKLLYEPSDGSTRQQRVLTRLAMHGGRVFHYPYNHYEHESACERLIDAFLTAVINNSDMPIPPEESMDAVFVCEAMIQSYQTGLPVRVLR